MQRPRVPGAAATEGSVCDCENQGRCSDCEGPGVKAWGLQRLRGAGVGCSDCEPGAQRLRGPWSCSKAGGLQRGRLGCSSASAFLGQHLWGDTMGLHKVPAVRALALRRPRALAPRRRRVIATSSPRRRLVFAASSSSRRRRRVVVATRRRSSSPSSSIRRVIRPGCSDCEGMWGLAAASCRACEGSWALQRLCRAFSTCRLDILSLGTGKHAVRAGFQNAHDAS